MNEFVQSFSNREISIISWTLFVVIIMLFINISGFITLVKSFFAKKLSYIYLLMLSYLGTIIYLFYKIGLWEISLYKDFLFWLLTSAFVMLFSFNKLKKTSDFKNIILKLLTVNIVLEFIGSNYNFSLLKELILIPCATFISIMIVVAQQKKKENEKVINFLNQILTFSGLIILCYVLYKLIESPEELFTIKNLKSFLLAPILTILFIPFVFLVTAYSKYEQIYMNINRYKFLNKSKKRQIKLAILKSGNLNLEYLNNAHNITIWRKAELQNEENIYTYIKNEIKNDIKFKG